MQTCSGKCAQGKALDAAPPFSPTGTGGDGESGALCPEHDRRVCVCANASIGYNQGELPHVAKVEICQFFPFMVQWFELIRAVLP